MYLSLCTLGYEPDPAVRPILAAGAAKQRNVRTLVLTSLACGGCVRKVAIWDEKVKDCCIIQCLLDQPIAEPI